MQEPDDHLLARFATHRDEAAFKALVDRYLGLIYHVALRRTGNREMAEEVSQNVLCAVVRKAAGLARHPERLPAWLHRATLFESSKAMRSEASHQRRKQLVHPDGIAATGDVDASPWHAALPVLDLALDRLPDADRNVVLGHYIEGKSFNQIGGEVSRPAATVQKQCRRALDKLTRILRGKGVVLSATALATGLSSQTAKAAPAALMKSAAVKALAGAATHSTTSLTFFMAMKSKATLPLGLLLLATPLVLQQIAISRTASRHEILQTSLSVTETSARAPARTSPVRTVSTGEKRITIDVLRRAMEEANSHLKRIEFEEMVAALDPTELETLIPQIFTLPSPWQEKTELLRHLVGALAKTDPGLAVRLACSADPQYPVIPNGGVEQAIFQWTSAEPDQAIEWLRELHGSLSDNNSSAFMNYQAAVAAPLILSGSPRAREIMTLSPDVYPEYVLRSAMDLLGEGKPGDGPEDFMVGAFSKFLPWIRELVAEDRSQTRSRMDRREAIEKLLWETDGMRHPLENPVPGKVLESLELLPAERRIIAENQAIRILETPYNTRPRPDRAKVDSSARDWLQAHASDEAEEIFATAKATAADRERLHIESSLRRLAAREVIRDFDILLELDRREFGEFPEFLPQALEQARRIKDPAKRAETILRLEASGKPSPDKP